jgi:outer membrane receptor for ferrienterochelin and colicin
LIRSFLLLLLLAPAAARAAWPAMSDEDEFFNSERASLEESLNVKTSVASKSSMSLRETPGLVTVITRDQIQSSGARDLLDVLKTVPELDFGVDVQGNLGIAVRGNWANEGKVLLIWDGQMQNETLYSTLQLDRYPIDQIEEIEIIKGPGSALYGGFGELAVINIRTLSARALKGSRAYAAYGQGATARAREYAGYSYGGIFSGTEVTAQAFAGDAQRSDRRYTDFSGNSYSLNGNSQLRPASLNLSAAKGNSSVRLILDDYYLRDRDQFGNVSTDSSKVSFPSVSASAETTIFLPGLARLEPKISYTRAQPWLEKDVVFPYEKTADRLTGSLTAFYRPAAMTDLMAGTEYYHDSVRVGGLTSQESSYSGGKTGASYDNYAFFGQGTFTLPLANLIAGARYDKHSQYGASLVPRIALTRLIEDFNFKAIYSQAFRAPSIENIRLNPGIKPEKATSEELEAGYKASDTVFVSGNVFQTAIKDPIIFVSTTSGGVSVESYKNYSHTGTYGFGLTLKLKDGAGSADLGYLCYFAHDNAVDVYSVPDRSSYLLGFPRHKVTLTSTLPLAAGITLNPTAVYTSKRYGYDGAGSVKIYGERVNADLNLQLKDRAARGLTLNFGVKDIFKSGYSYVQPYEGGHAALPAASREIFIKGDYAF